MKVSYLPNDWRTEPQADGKNMIWDITMSSEESTAGRINDLRKADYTQVDGLLVNISVETSIRRIESRHREGHDEWRAGRAWAAGMSHQKLSKNKPTRNGEARTERFTKR